jgi:hypothetical protein
VQEEVTATLPPSNDGGIDGAAGGGRLVMSADRSEAVARLVARLLPRHVSRRTAVVAGVGFVLSPGAAKAGFIGSWKRGTVIQPVSRAIPEVTSLLPENVANWAVATGGMLSFSAIADLGYTPDNGLLPNVGEILFTSCSIGIKLVDGVPQCADSNPNNWGGYARFWGDSDYINRAKVVIRATAETPADNIRHKLCHETGHALGHDADHPPAGTDSCITDASGISTPGSYDSQGLQAALAKQKDPPGNGGGSGGNTKNKCKGKKKKKKCKGNKKRQ